MSPSLMADWPVLALAAAVVLLALWWLLAGRGRRGTTRSFRPDVLDEGVGPAQRNQALIDAPPAAAVAVPPSAPDPSAQGGDDLSRIKGVGPKLQALLPTLGLTTYARIAALSDADLAELDARLGAFAGRPARDNWVEQARLLAAQDVAGFEAKFGKV